jgi:hypothetical protein
MPLICLQSYHDLTVLVGHLFADRRSKIVKLMEGVETTTMEDSQEDSKVIEMPSTASQTGTPLEMNCEDAISFIISYMQSENFTPGIAIPDFTSLSNSALLDSVAEMLLTPALTDCVGIAFYPLLPDLIGRWTLLEQARREEVASAMGRLIHFEPRLKRYHPLHFSNSGTHRNYCSRARRFCRASPI